MKNLNNFIEEAAKKRCPQGQYWCYTDKKCKPIPKGWHVLRTGYLAKDEDESKKNGNGKNGSNGNGNSNGSHGNGNGGNGNGGNGGGNGGGVSESVQLYLETPNNQIEFDLGLMFRESLEENTGMLFTFEEAGEKFFHMKNTTIPLDIAFINKYGIIESIKELVPLSTIPVSSDFNVLYAIEVNRGWFEKNNVDVGDKILDI